MGEVISNLSWGLYHLIQTNTRGEGGRGVLINMIKNYSQLFILGVEMFYVIVHYKVDLVTTLMGNNTQCIHIQMRLNG